MSENQKQGLCEWVGREFNLTGVLAAGGAEPGAAAFAAFVSGELVLAHDPSVWQCVGDGLAALREAGAPAGELLWGFEHAVLCTVQREDGTWLGVFTAPDLGDEPAIALHAKLDAFKQKQAGALFGQDAGAKKT